jgi:micrococcal nuclease
VTGVVDGDTIVLESGEPVRYIGIDTPEADECYGQEATEMNRQLVEGKTVILISDVEERDRYDRLLRYVIVDGRFVNAELVRLGYARAQSYGDNVMFQQVLTIFDRYANESGAGLWGACAHE